MQTHANRRTRSLGKLGRAFDILSRRPEFRLEAENLRRRVIYHARRATVLGLLLFITSAEVSPSVDVPITITNQTIASISLSSNSFTGGAADSTTIGSITVTMSPASPAFSGSLSLTGTQTGSGNDKDSFKVASSNLQTNTAGGATDQPGAYNINIVATQSGITNSPFTQAEAITATGPGGAGWQLSFSDEFVCPNNMLQCLSIVSASNYTWASSFCSGLSAPSATGCGTLTVASLPNNITSGNCTGSNLGACAVSVAGATNSGAGGAAAVNGTFLVVGVPNSTTIVLYMPYTGIGTIGLGSGVTVGSGPWVFALATSCATACSGLPLVASNDNGDSEYWDPHACTVASGQMKAVLTNTNNYVPPSAMQTASGGTFTLCHIQTWNASSGNAQAQEAYFDSYFEVPPGSFHTTFWVLSSGNNWNNGPELDIGEFSSSTTGQQFNVWDGSSQHQIAITNQDYSAAFHQFGVDNATSGTGALCSAGNPTCFFLDGARSNSAFTAASTTWAPAFDIAIDTGYTNGSSRSFPANAFVEYIRMFKHVASGACYSTIPAVSTIPHTGTC